MGKKFFWLLMIGSVIVSCGDSKKDNEGNLNDKKARLEDLKKHQASLTDSIRKLENEIALLDTSAEKSKNAKLVALTPLTTQSFVHYIDLQGKVEAENSSFVSPRLGPGLVKAVYVREGDAVRKGQLLLKLDDAVIRQQLAAQRSGLSTMEVQLATARDLSNRRETLWKQGIGAEMQVIEARTNVKALETQLATAKQSIGIIQEQLNATNIYADVAGVAEIVNIRPGETFTGMAGTMPQISIVNKSSLKATVQVPENYAGKVRTGAPVVVVIPDINKRWDDLKISRAGQSIDPSTRTFTAETKIPSDPLIRPNQIVQIRIQDYQVPNTIAIPVNTVQSDDKGKYVFLAANEGDRMVARKKYVQVGEMNGALIEIKDGALKTGDRLITDGYQNLYEGQVITEAVK
ncbi:MAG: efflux RND transporter periplasmic adaptor subunit [Flavisolibacter sp.]